MSSSSSSSSKRKSYVSVAYKRPINQSAANELLSLENIIGSLRLSKNINSIVKAADETVPESVGKRGETYKKYVSNALQNPRFLDRVHRFLCFEGRSDEYWRHFLKSLKKEQLVLLSHIIYKSDESTVPPPKTANVADHLEFAMTHLETLKNQLCAFYATRGYHKPTISEEPLLKPLSKDEAMEMESLQNLLKRTLDVGEESASKRTKRARP